MSAQAKMRCTWNQQTQWATIDQDTHIVRFAPVSGDSDENKEWSKYTPSGSIEMHITNPAAFDQFEENAEYLLTFDRVS
jgi:hypothetical protein